MPVSVPTWLTKLKAVKSCFTQHRTIQYLQGAREPFRAGAKVLSQKWEDDTCERCLGEGAEEGSWGISCVLVVRLSARWSLYGHVLSLKKVEI